MKIKPRILVLLALCCGLAAPINTLGGGWGIERGRANEGDVARLLVDQLAMKMAQNRIEESIRRPLAVERQRQLLGTSGGGFRADELLDGVYEWWLKDVMGPAVAIAGNPAASCAEAQIAFQSLLGMMRQRQLLGMSPDENDHSASANATRALEAQLDELFDSTKATGTTRCQEEALDECLATGRFDQIIQTQFGSERGEQLLGGGGTSTEWVNDALKQCAVYDLHFVSTTKTSQIFNLETVRRSKITLRFEAGEGGVISAIAGGKKLKDLLKGETLGDVFLDSAKCTQPPLQVTCKPGEILSQNTARVIEMKLQHREFYVDANGISRERIVGEDKFSFEFGGGIYGVEGLIIIPKYGTVPFPMKAIGYGFYIAHKKDRLGVTGAEGSTVKVERNKRGAYPVIFDFIYADQNTESNASVSDSTEFKLIHKPEPAALPARPPEPTRKPLKPSTRIKKIGG